MADATALPAVQRIVAQVPSDVGVRLFCEVVHEDDAHLLDGDRVRAVWLPRSGNGLFPSRVAGCVVRGRPTSGTMSMSTRPVNGAPETSTGPIDRLPTGERAVTWARVGRTRTAWRSSPTRIFVRWPGRVRSSAGSTTSTRCPRWRSATAGSGRRSRERNGTRRS
ncbi:SIP domain-containing protein [Streptomyces sp. NPDC059816]|uniref:SIP domain-containing protein n=1 Tax=Streptomyces sp. NPDC059816 TaxID=3346960 RepID=UPI0036632366